MSNLFPRSLWLAAAIAGSVLAGQVAVAADPAAPLKVHIVSGSGEYRSEPSLRELQTHLERHYRVACSASWGRDGATRLDDLEHLAGAELLILFARRLKLDDEAMQLFRQHWEAGKPIVGIRTAGHAFQNDDNAVFDRQVLGGHYQGHYGGEPVQVANVGEHPILQGVGPFTSRKLYKCGPLPESTVVLQTGDIGQARHPVTIVHEYRGGRMFFTSLGVPEDFQKENFRRLLLNAIAWTTGRDLEQLRRP